MSTGIQAFNPGSVGVSVDITTAGTKLIGGDITELQKLRMAGDLAGEQNPKAYRAGNVVFLSAESYCAGALVSGLGSVTGVGTQVMNSLGKAGVYTLDGALIGGSVAAVNSGAEYVLGDVTSEEYLKTVCTASVAGAAAGLTAYGVEKLVGSVANTASNIKQAETGTPKTTDKTDYVRLSEKPGNKLENEGYEIISVEDASVANRDWADLYYDLPPVAESTKVYNVEAGEFKYARVYREGTNRSVSPFVLRADDIEGLTAEQIAQKYALPQIPDKIVYVDLPADTPLEVSITGPQETWGTVGGEAQYAIKDVNLKESWFTNINNLQ